MAFLPSVFYMRKIKIISLLMSANAFSADTAKRLDEIGLTEPYAFPSLTVRMIKRNVISVTGEGKVYLCQ
jgi:hypothetical protein